MLKLLLHQNSNLVLPLALLTESQLFPSSWLGWFTAIGLGIFCQGFAALIFIHSLNKFSAGFVSLFLLLDPILTSIFAWIIFAEQLSFLNWVAFTIVLMGIYFAKSGQDVEKMNSDRVNLSQDY